jgi:hypothetical protein
MITTSRHPHRITRNLLKLGAMLTLAAGGVGLNSLAASAAPNAVVDLPASGLAVQCSLNGAPVTYTATSGTMHMVNQGHIDANGVFHFTGTVSLQNVTATDGTTSTTYQVVGASWFGGGGTSPSTATVRSTDEFNIVGPQGKVASVHAHLTFNPDGSVTGAVLGECAPPA